MMRKRKQACSSAKLPVPVNHIAGLDGLRGIAVIGVILYHLFPETIKGGFLGVSLFFVLSGYLMAITSERYWDGRRFKIITFYKKRISRIYPSLIFVVLITAEVLKILAPEVLNGIREEILSIFLGYNNIWQISQNASYFTRISNASPFTHLWSLSIELQFYFIWPLFYVIYTWLNQNGKKEYSRYVFIIPSVFSVLCLQFLFRPGQDVTNVYYNTITRMFSLFMGAYVGFSCRKTKRRHMSRVKAVKQICLFVICMILLIISYIFTDGQSYFTYRIGLWASTVLFCEILKWAVNPDLPIGKWLDCKLLSWIGKRSYEIYLWQYPVIFIFQYSKWDCWSMSPLIMGGLILIFAVWLQKILSIVVKKLEYGGRKMRQIKKLTFGVLTCFFSITFVLGGCSIATAPNTKGESQERLKEELEANSEKLEQQNQKNLSVNQTGGLSGTVSAIGDSVMLGAVPSIQKLIPGCVIDAGESRQVIQAGEVIESLDQQGSLGNTVIIALGTNGSFDLSSGQEIIDRLGRDRDIYWVTVYGTYLQWQDSSNETIYQLSEKNENVHIIDWAGEASSHPEWFYEDGIHLNVSGQEAYADLILKSIT